ncbi:hypothetical protein G9A89_009278 [Geosiphon pyriformis]|nr:hypothetical protein G9A89_009278 [Geosiphon pyriformis]
MEVKSKVDDYVDDNAFSGVMNTISLDNLICVIKNLPDGKTAGLSVVKDALKKDHELWLVLQDIHKAYNSVNWHYLHNTVGAFVNDTIWVLSWSPIHSLYCPVKLHVSLGLSLPSSCIPKKVWFSIGRAFDIGKDLIQGGSCEIKCGAAVYFSNLDLGIGAKVGGLVFLTMVELQAIALALECVPPNSSVVVYSDSQAVLDASSLAVGSTLALLVLEVGSDFNVINNSLRGDVDWSYTALV